MADAAAAEGKLYKDEVTGEMISKSELKRREKQRKKEADKAGKASAAPPPAASAGASSSAGGAALAAATAAAEEELSPTQYFEMRSRTIQKLRETREPDPYPHKFHVSVSLTDYVEKYQDRIQPGEKIADDKVTVAGRIHNIRYSGNKLRFYDLWGEGVKVQIMATLQ